MYKHITVLFLIHLCFHLNLCFEWNKCCEPFQNLIKTKVNNTWIYECSNITENSAPLIVKKIQNDVGITIDCTDNIKCVDKFINPRLSNGQIVALNCENELNTNVPKFPTINKCCPDGLYYNKIMKKCNRDASSTIDQLHDSLADVFNINYGFPKCGRRVYTEDEYENISLSVQNGTLQLTVADDFTKIFPNGTYCMDTRKNDDILSGVIVHCISTEYNVKKFCTDNTCVPKCCPFGHIYKKGIVKKFECFPEWEKAFEPPFHNESGPENFYLLDQPVCRGGKYLKNNSEYTLLKNGTFHTSKTLFYESFHSKYCLEKIDIPTYPGYTGVICFAKITRDFWKMFIFLTGIIISILFLGVTLIIYFFLPELQNLHGRTVMSHTTSLLAAYICLAFVKQAKTDYGPNTCMILGYGIMFTFLSAFTWLNVMCFDIWWTFGVVKARGITKNKDLKKFLYYCIYAHGLPLIITSIAITVDLHPDVPSIYKPKIAKYSCWFNLVNGVQLEYTIFFIIPVATLITCNITLFVLTARHCLKIRRDIQRMQHNDSPKKKRFLADKETFLMNIKLFIVMGITWSFELISAYVRQPEELWIVFDTINALQGLWIFFIFVFKDNVWKAIKKKLGYATIQEGSTQATLSTKMSIASNTSIKLNGLKPEEKDLLQNVVKKNRDKNDD